MELRHGLRLVDEMPQPFVEGVAFPGQRDEPQPFIAHGAGRWHVFLERDATLEHAIIKSRTLCQAKYFSIINS
jgi:hypothetical protein